MDLYQLIKQLQDENRRLDQVIASLEALTNEGVAPPKTAVKKSTRGRKGMSKDERERVSERMRTYWASRRKPATVANES